MERSLDLVREELRELGTHIVDDAGRPDQAFGVYAFTPEAPEAELARWVEREVFNEVFGNSADMLEAEYGPYDDGTVFVVALDNRRRLPAGMLRLVLPSPAGSKSLDDIERGWGQPLGDVLARTGIEFPLDSLLDVVTVAVAPDYRRPATDGLVSLALYQAVAAVGVLRPCAWIVAILDLVVLALLDQTIKDPFRRFAGIEPRSYLDSPESLPVYMDCDAYLTRLATTDPTMHGILARQTGLEAAVRALDWERVPDRMKAGATSERD